MGKIVCKINDSRLTVDMILTRSGKKQLFRKKYNDGRFTTEDNADVVLQPPRREIYAKLIDGEWYWVNGCAECNGKPRSCNTYIECEKHDVCRTCGISRKDLNGAIVWGGVNGWQCKTCHNIEAEETKQEALKKMSEKEYYESDFQGTDNVICPHCGSSYDCDCEIPEGDEVCDVCGGEYTVEPEWHVTFSTSCKGERIKYKS